MPVCKKCDTNFRNHAIIDGKSRNLSKRKYCLVCSPWGLHNTRPLLSDIEEAKSRILGATSNNYICKCSKVYVVDRKKGNSDASCGSCKVNDRRLALKIKAVAYKGGGCERCGYSRSIQALQFHHQDPKAKDFGIGGHHCLTWSRIQAELDKCLMLCANCHTEEHERTTRDLRSANMLRIESLIESSDAKLSKSLDSERG